MSKSSYPWEERTDDKGRTYYVNHETKTTHWEKPVESGKGKATIFVGNPGTGKSTLLNALAGSNVFKSGISFGRGMTSKIQEFKLEDGSLLVDTPGLSDVKLREQAGEEIYSCLSRGWDGLRLIFVLTIEGGRVRPDDSTTISLILKSMDASPKVSFGIVINKLPEEELMFLQENENVRTLVGESLLSGTERTTTHFHVIMLSKALHGKNNASMPEETTANFKAFLKNVPFVSLKSSHVSKIEDFDKIKEKLEEEIQAQNKVLEKLKKDFEAKLESEKEKQQNELEKEKERANEEEEKIRRETKEKKQELENIRKQNQSVEQEIESLKQQEQVLSSKYEKELKLVDKRLEGSSGESEISQTDKEELLLERARIVKHYSEKLDKLKKEKADLERKMALTSRDVLQMQRDVENLNSSVRAPQIIYIQEHEKGCIIF